LLPVAADGQACVFLPLSWDASLSQKLENKNSSQTEFAAIDYDA